MTGGDTRNEVSGTVSGTVVQAQSVTVNLSHAYEPPAPSIPWQVPEAPRGFVNRADEIRLLDRLVAGTADAPRVAVLNGTAGVGKTALARRWAQQVRDAFADGQLYADLRDASAPIGDVLEGFLAALGVPGAAVPAGLDERVKLYRSHTSGRRLLVMIDNVGQVAQAESLLPAGHGCAALVTSHWPMSPLLRDGALPVEVGLFGGAHGLRLLAERLGAERVDAEPEDAARLVELCGGLPIALHVAASTLLRHPRWSIADLVDDLTEEAERLQRLTEEGTATVSEVIDRAYRSLPDDAAVAYRRLGAHPGPDFDLAVASVLCDLSERATRRVIDVLCDARLLDDVAQFRYRFHDLVRLHARTLADEDTEAALRRAVTWYLGVGQRADVAVTDSRRLRLGAAVDLPSAAAPAFAGTASGLGWLLTEHANLLSCVRAASGRRWYGDVWRLCEVLWVLYNNHKLYAEWEESHRLGIEAAAACGDPAAEARMRAQLARALIEQGELDAAATELDRALTLATAAGHVLLQASVMEFTGVLHEKQGSYDKALSLFRRSLEINRAERDGRGITMQTYLLGRALAGAGEYPEAVESLRAALGGEGVDDRLRGRILLALGRAYLGTGEYEAAARELASVIEGARARSAPYDEAQALEALADVAAASGDPAAHRAALTRARDLYRDISHPRAATLTARLSP